MNDMHETNPVNSAARDLQGDLFPAHPPRAFKPIDRVAAPICYLLAVAFLYFGIEGGTVGVWLALSALFVAAPFYLRRFGISLSAPAKALLAMPALFALPQILFDDGNVYAASLVLSILGFLYALHYACAELGRSRLPGEALLLDAGKAVLGMPFAEFGAATAAVSGIRGKRVARTLGLIVGGLFLALVPTMIVTVLLASADNRFNRLMDDILNTVFDADLHLGSLGFSLIVGIPLTCYVFGAIWACGTHALGGGVKDETVRATVTGVRVVPATMACAAVVPMLLVYLLFFSTQIPYFIGGFTGTLPEGLTYAAYARKGFFELCTVAVINAGMLGCLNLLTRREGDRLPLVPRILGITLSVSTLILLSTAIAKMLLYVDTYGLSRKRLYTLWLMAFLALYFVIKIAALITPRVRASAIIFALALLFALIFLFGNFDGIIARYNVDAYLDGRHEAVDVEMLGELSSSAVPHLVRLQREMTDPEGQRLVREEIDCILAELLDAEQDYLSWNFTDARALACIKSSR